MEYKIRNMKFPKKKFKKINLFYHEYIDFLNKTLKNIDLKKLKLASDLIEKKILKNKTIFVCGNGGSAAIANHFVCDYTKLLRSKTKLKPKVHSLSTNMELLTAISNDFAYDEIFSRQLEYYAQRDSLVIIISSSGNSKNVIKALDYCNKNKIQTIGFCGFEGGYLSRKAKLSLHFFAENYGISEDSHHISMHIIMQFLRQKFIRKNISKIIF